ncbi:hypothetical protein LTR94_030403, partial [Friedmanniomyces endolithicus]
DLLLDDRGQIGLDDRNSNWMVDSPESWKAVTVLQLLNHTSGLVDFTRLDSYDVLKSRPTSTVELIAHIRDQPLEFQPGERFAYSNSGYVILARLIEIVSGATYAEFVEQNLFSPLQMTDSGYDHQDIVLSHRASGYIGRGADIRHAGYLDMSVPSGAGGLYSTTRDLLRWERGLFDGDLLTSESLKALTTPGRGAYGLGLMAAENDGAVTVWHDGAIDGFNSYM